MNVSYVYLLSTPPSSEALRHSGGDSLLWTSPTVTLYLEVELRRERRPGTEQNTSLMLTVTPPIRPSFPSISEPTFLGGMGTAGQKAGYRGHKDGTISVVEKNFT